MTSTMSYQYPPPPPPNGTEMDIPPPGYMSNYGVPQPGESPMDMRSGQESPISSKDRRDSLSQASQKTKLSLSTPNVRAQQHSPDHGSMGMSSSDKRRNKLGYHRTSVACGHCRRRKIRCIPSPADVQGRCVNCMRLKKECSFYPVDQQPPPDARSKASSRSSTATKIASASSSPAISSGHLADIASHQPYPPLAMPPIHSMPPPGVKSSGPDGFSPDAKLPTSSSSSGRAFDFASQGMTNWMSTDQNPNPAAKPGDIGGPWRGYPQESPITPSFSPYTPHAPPAGWNAPVSAESAPREDLPWQPYPPPPRSISFGGEGLGTQTTGPYTPGQNRQYEQKAPAMASDVYPSTIASSVSGVDAVPGVATMEHRVPLSAGAVPPSGYGTWQQQYPYAKPGETYGNWGYGENGSSTPVAAGEQIPPASDGQTPAESMYYSPR